MVENGGEHVGYYMSMFVLGDCHARFLHRGRL